MLYVIDNQTEGGTAYMVVCAGEEVTFTLTSAPVCTDKANQPLADRYYAYVRKQLIHR